MALTEWHNWLIAYDIREPKRLSRVHRFLVKHGVPVQYSVFVTRNTAQRIGRIKAGLAELIAPVDDVRIYQIPERVRLTTYGRQYLPHELLLIGEGGSVRPWMPFTGMPAASKVEEWSDTGEEVMS
jgi:CRISPR-associated protein Cas2